MSTTQEHFDAIQIALENNNVDNLKRILDSFDVAETIQDNVNGNDGVSNCLMSVFSEKSSSPEGVKLVFEKIAEAGGTPLLKKQLTARNDIGHKCLEISSIRSSPEVVTLLAVVLSHLGLFQDQYTQLNEYCKAKLRAKTKTGIDSPSWTPDPESLAEVVTLLKEGNFIHAIRSNQQSNMIYFLKYNESPKKILDSKFDTIMRACGAPETTLETVSILLSEIKRIGGGNQYLKEFLSKENAAGETCLLSVCLSYLDRLKFFLKTIQEVGGEEFLAEQISKKRASDGMSCLYALCKFAPKYESLSLFVGKIFESEFLGRRYLMRELSSSNSYPECLFSRPLDSRENMKFLSLMSDLYSVTGLFEDQYSRLDKEKKGSLHGICNIKSGRWSRATSNASPVGDLIGDIKKSILI